MRTIFDLRHHALLLTLPSLACAPSNQGPPPSNPPGVGMVATPPCRSVNYAYEQRSPYGESARDLVTEHGRPRSAPFSGKPADLAALGVVSDARPVLSLSFEYLGGPVEFKADCWPGALVVPVLLTVRLSTGQSWRSKGTLSVPGGDWSATVRADPDQNAPFYLSARLLPGHTDVELTPESEIHPLRFTTLCGVLVDSSVKKQFGTELGGVIALSQTARLTCSGPGAQALAAPPPGFAVTLVRHDDEACHPYPGVPPEFSVALHAAAAWAPEALRGRATLGKDGTVPTLHYSVGGKARAETLGGLLPCAAQDNNVSVVLEGGARATEPPARERGKLRFHFSCQDVAVQCWTD